MTAQVCGVILSRTSLELLRVSPDQCHRTLAAFKRNRLYTTYLCQHTLLCDVQLFDSFYA